MARLPVGSTPQSEVLAAALVDAPKAPALAEAAAQEAPATVQAVAQDELATALNFDQAAATAKEEDTPYLRHDPLLQKSRAIG